MKSRYIAVVAGVAVAGLSLSACSSSEPTSSTEPTDSLTIATTSNNQGPMEAVVAAYEEKTGLDVNLTVADTSQFQTTIRTQL